MKYEFVRFMRPELSIPELADGFDPSLDPPEEGMAPVSFCTGEVEPGVYAIHIALEALEDISRLYLFTGRKLLREIVSLKKGERCERTFYQSAAEIIPRYHEERYPVRHLFFTYCTRRPEAVRVGRCYAEVANVAGQAASGPSAADGTTGQPTGRVPVVWLCGDSTVTDQSCEIPYNPGFCYASWGQALPAFLSGRTAVENQAHCGLSTETFRSEGHMDIVKKHLRPGDFCLIQFAHNDQKLPHLQADREYPANLRRYVAEVRTAGATPVLVTPLGRNIWRPDGSYHELLAEHTQAVKDVAAETGTAVIDLHADSLRFFADLGMENACGYFHPGDCTHTNEYGAYRFASFIAKELCRLYPGAFSPAPSPAVFTPPAHLWDTLEQKNNRAVGAGQKEQFDCMEKSVAALLETIERAKGAR